MSDRMNYGRVAMGTLAAGFAANVCDFITNGFLLAEDMHRMQARLNLDPAVVGGTPVMVTWIAVDFVLAFLTVWTYAAIRARLGAGPTTAIIAAMVPFVAATAVLAGFQQMGVFTPDTFLKATLLSFTTWVIAGLAGGYVYQEED
jgi:hypothetical protein